MVHAFRYNGMNGAYEKQKELIEKFNNAILNGADPKVEMQNFVVDVYQAGLHFAESYNYTEDYKRTAQTHAVAQIYTDIMMKNFSPAAYDKERFGEFLDGYILNNQQLYKDILLQRYINEYTSQGISVSEFEIESTNKLNTIPEDTKNTYAQAKEERQKIEIPLQDIEGTFLENAHETQRLHNLKMNNEYYENLLNELQEKDINKNNVL